MARIFISPSKYVQGAGVLGELGEYSKVYGSHALVIITAGGMRRSGDVIREALLAADIAATFDVFNGECSRTEIARLVDVMGREKADFVIGVGGGKIFDTAKEVANTAEVPVAIVPTIAATDAPCSSCSVIYTDEGQYEAVVYQRHNPDLVLMDTDVIAKSPVRLTVSGMGDALATYFEARATRQSDSVTPAHGKIAGAAYALAEYCYRTLINDGPKAKLALEVGARSEAVERVIEANTLASGLGFESGGLAAAHAIYNGMTALPGTHDYYHGEKVAFGTLTQLVMEDAPELDECLDFCIKVGLPVTFEQLGMGAASYEDVLKVATLACDPADTLVNMPFEVSPELVANAMIATDAIGRKALADRA